MSQPKGPQIRFEKDLEIGYDKPLAKFSEAVELGGGTHFLLARNGRGKTTLLRTIAGTLKPIQGEFHHQGFMQYLPENVRFDPFITPKTIFKTLLSKDRFKQSIELADRIELDVDKPFGKLSTGNRRKTTLITAEFSISEDRGNILLLDEPFSGLDAFARAAFEEIWKDSKENVLRLVSCHPDYDTMQMPSALLIEGLNARHLSGEDQTWSTLKHELN
ncbi:MAG: ATP-binding cassette domain-containing protein [Akkermansiaceae bacterium]|nr:ATP-binding cassette domain-containing protein [Akkermansiaceae bacterium]